MMKKFLVLLLISVFILTIPAGCGQKQEQADVGSSTKQGQTGAQDSGENQKELTYDVLFVISKERVPDKPSLLDQVLKEKFNIVMEWQEVPQSSIEEKLNLLFASNQQPDMMWPVGVLDRFPKKLGMDGFLVPVNEHWDKLPNYRKLWTDEQWEDMLAFESNADGNLYYLPQKNYRVTAGAWIYRKSAFDEMGLEFPKTVDELYTTLKTIKEKYPNSIPMPNRGGAGGVLGGLLLAYRIKSGDYGSYIDPDTDELIPYGEATDAYREILKHASRYYKEGLIDREFATVTEQQWTERYANGKTFIEYSYATRAAWANETMAAADPNAKWEWSRENITAYPEKGFMYSAEKAHVGSGPFFTKKMGEEKLDRILQVFDWFSTEEGSLFICMGKEGVTYEIKDGEPVFMPHMYHSERNPKGDPEWKYGLYLGNIVQHPAYIKEVGKITDLELSNAMTSNPKAKAFKNIPWKLTVEEEKQLADLATIIKDVKNEYTLKFIMGELDPNNDNHWNDYINALNKVGLKQLSEIRAEAYKRIAK